MKVSIIHDLKGRENPVRYVFETIVSNLGMPTEISAIGNATGDGCAPIGERPEQGTPAREHVEEPEGVLHIQYGHGLPSHGGVRNAILISASSFFGPSYSTAESLPKGPFELINYPGVGEVPVLFRGEGQDAGHGQPLAGTDTARTYIRFEAQQRIVHTNLDLVAGTFFLLSRYEELFTGRRDHHGRFTPESGGLGPGFYTRPVANLYLEVLWDWMRRVSPSPISNPDLYPGDCTMAACITHDVDLVRKWHPQGLAARTWKRLGGDGTVPLWAWLPKLEGLIARLWASLFRWDPYWTFSDLVRYESERGLKPAFYFMATDPDRGPNPPDYDLGRQDVRKLALSLAEKGCEIGLHGSYESSEDARLLSLERERMKSVLGLEPQGVRQHFLRFDVPQTWNIQEKVGFRYDSSLGFASVEGFRAGFCHPFQPYDVMADRRINIWEMPVMVMDKTLYSREGSDPARAFALFQRIFEEARRYRGVLVVLWHNSTLADLGDTRWREFYRKMIDLLSSDGVLGATPSAIIGLWEAMAKCAHKPDGVEYISDSRQASQVLGAIPSADQTGQGGSGI